MFKRDDDHEKQQRKANVHNVLDARPFGFGPVFYVHEVNAERGSQCRQGRVGTGVGGCRNAQQKRNAYRQAEVIQGQQRVQIIGTDGNSNAFAFGEYIQQHAQRKKHKIDEYQRARKPEHVFLGLADVAAGQVFLHQVLIQTGHHDGNENTGNELLEKVLGIVGIPEENLRHLTALDAVHQPTERQTQLLRNEHDGQHYRRNQKQRLQ